MERMVKLLCSLFVVGLLGSSCAGFDEAGLGDYGDVSLSPPGDQCFVKLIAEQIRDILTGAGQEVNLLENNVNLLSLVKAYYKISNLKIVELEECGVNIVEVSLGEDNTYTISASVNIKALLLSGKLQYSLHVKPINYDDEAEIDIGIKAEVKLDLVIRVSFDEDYRPTVVVEGCDLKVIAKVDITGVPALLEKALEAALPDPIHAILKLKICAAVKLAFTSDDIKSQITLLVLGKTHGLFKNQDLLYPLTVNVSGLVKKIIDQILELLKHILLTITDNSKLPADYAGFLDTTCDDVCIGTVLKTLGDRYPNLPVVLKITVTNLEVLVHDLLHAKVRLTLEVLLSLTDLDGNVKELVLEVKVDVDVNVALDGKILEGDLVCVVISITVVRSDFGYIPLDQLEVLKEYLGPILCFSLNNLADQYDVPIPLNVEFLRPLLKTVGDLVVVVADFVCELLGGAAVLPELK